MRDSVLKQNDSYKYLIILHCVNPSIHVCNDDISTKKIIYTNIDHMNNVKR